MWACNICYYISSNAMNVKDHIVKARRRTKGEVDNIIKTVILRCEFDKFFTLEVIKYTTLVECPTHILQQAVINDNNDCANCQPSNEGINSRSEYYSNQLTHHDQSMEVETQHDQSANLVSDYSSNNEILDVYEDSRNINLQNMEEAVTCNDEEHDNNTFSVVKFI